MWPFPQRFLFVSAFIFPAVLLCLCFPVRLSAATYVDDMTDLDNNHIKSYQNLAPFTAQDRSWSRLPDTTMFTFASPGLPRASATYQIQGADSVTAAIYTQNGAFVAAVPGESGRYSCGVSQDSVAYLSSQHTVQAMHSASRDAVYARLGNSLHKMMYNGAYYEFFGTNETPGDLTGYGVNIYHSVDGSSYTRLSPRMTNVVMESGIYYVYEEYTASLPASARYVRVEINDITQIPMSAGGVALPKRAGTMASLASVSFSGSNLALGAPPELSSESDPVTESAAGSSSSAESESSSSSQSSAGSKASSSSRASSSGSSTGAGGGAAAGGSVAAASSKFEGVIVSSSGEKSASAKNAAASSAKSGQASSATPASSGQAASAPAAEAAEEAQAIPFEVHMAATAPGSGFSLGVTAYIVAVAGGILFLLLRITGSGKK